MQLPFLLNARRRRNFNAMPPEAALQPDFVGGLQTELKQTFDELCEVVARRLGHMPGAQLSPQARESVLLEAAKACAEDGADALEEPVSAHVLELVQRLRQINRVIVGVENSLLEQHAALDRHEELKQRFSQPAAQRKSG